MQRNSKHGRVNRPKYGSSRSLAPPNTVYVIRRYRGNAVNLRTQLGRIIGRVGVVPWEKLFVNLRASARTDFQEIYPSHVCDAWLGHSTRIAERHYLQTTQAHWTRAISEGIGLGGYVGDNTGGNIPANPKESGASQNGEIPPNERREDCKFVGITTSVPQRRAVRGSDRASQMRSSIACFPSSRTRPFEANFFCVLRCASEIYCGANEVVYRIFDESSQQRWNA